MSSLFFIFQLMFYFPAYVLNRSYTNNHQQLMCITNVQLTMLFTML